MTELEAIKNRHAVRDYLDKGLSREVVASLQEELQKCNQDGQLHFQLITENADAFKSFLPVFGRFKNVKNYIALVAKKQKKMYELCGYYGADIMIRAQQMGLNTCFVTGSYHGKKCPVSLAEGEELIGVIAIGYGKTSGKPHKSKDVESLCKPCNSEWFKNGMRAAILAPTGYNKQHFFIESNGTKVSLRATDDRAMSQIDKGIIKYHFEVGAGKENFQWA